MSKPAKLIEDLAGALESAYPELDAIRAAAAPSEPVFLVGGAVRDLLLGRGRADIDIVVEGDASALASRLGAGVVEHERFATAKVSLNGHEVDVAAARTETYPHPGALPEVAAAGFNEDLARRDFTINAMAIPLVGDPHLIDPFSGRDDLAAGVLRVMHAGSFLDDPTRALRAARYASRFDFDLEPETAELLRGAALDTVSADRCGAELRRLAAEPHAVVALELAATWELVALREGGVELAFALEQLLSAPPWRDLVERPDALLAAALGPPGRELELVAATPHRPSEGVDLAAGCTQVELALARALGAEWLDRYVSEWCQVGLQIDGSDLIAAGVSEGPALGRGLRAALRRKLDGEVESREQELAAALAAAREPDEVA